MQKELTKGPLLDEKGNLTEAGFSFRMVKEYDRSKIKAGKSRIKEWDYYYIGNNKHGVAFTIDDNSLYGLGSNSWLSGNLWCFTIWFSCILCCTNRVVTCIAYY